MKSEFTKQWIIENSVDIVSEYDRGVLTLRGLHYRLVSLGMTNDVGHYKKVVNSLISARWDGIIDFEAFSDHDRAMIGETKSEYTELGDEIEKAKESIQAWMNYYFRNRWENQPYYPEVFIEKKALQGVFQPVCLDLGVGLGACKGYPSLTFLNDAAKRFQIAEENGKMPIILYFGDYDPSGEDIPRSIGENLSKFGIDVEVRRISLLEDQVVEWKLPPAPTKISDTRTAQWDGLGQVELDAVAPSKLQRLCREAIENIFDEDLHDELIAEEKIEREKYKTELKNYVIGIK